MISSYLNHQCCEKQDIIIDDKGVNVCCNCGTVNSYGIAKDYIDIYENKDRFRQKSVYQRKYHLENKLRDMQISVANLNKIHQVFIEKDNKLPQINGDRKRMISIIINSINSINFVLKQLFKILSIPHENIPVTKSKKNEVYWMKIKCCYKQINR